jgi:hypothetical protein
MNNAVDNSSFMVNSNTEKSVMIICGPNGITLEIFAYCNRWIDYYIDCGMSVFIWNYRGYGDSTGFPEFENIRKDSESVANLLKDFYKYDKIGVHGISIGGLAACHLAGKNLVSFCLADRTFSSMNNLLGAFPYYTKIICFLYKALFFNSSDNVDAFINSKAFKIVSCDPCDSIISELASLKSGIAHAIIKKENKKPLLLENILKDEELESFYDSLIAVIDSIGQLNLFDIDRSVELSARSPRKNDIIEYKNITESNNATKEIELITDISDEGGRTTSRILGNVRYFKIAKNCIRKV